MSNSLELQHKTRHLKQDTMQIAANTAINSQSSTMSRPLEKVVNQIITSRDHHALTSSILTATKILYCCHTFNIISDFEQAMTLTTIQLCKKRRCFWTRYSAHEVVVSRCCVRLGPCRCRGLILPPFKSPFSSRHCSQHFQ